MAYLNHPEASATFGQTGFAIPGDWTFEFWVRWLSPFGGDENQGVIFWQNELTADVAGIRVMRDRANDNIVISLHGSSCSISLPSLDEGRVTHIAAVRSGNRLTGYVDGQAIGTALNCGVGLRNGGSMSLGVPSGHQHDNVQNSSAARVMVGSIRLSRVARYSDTFVPRITWLIDDNTVWQALTHNRNAINVRNPFSQGVIADYAGGDNDGAVRRSVSPETGVDIVRGFRILRDLGN